MSDTPLFWSKKGLVKCRQHAPDSASPEWAADQWQAIPAPETTRRRYQCQDCERSRAEERRRRAAAVAPLILNVDDREANLYARDQILRRHGFIVANAETGHGALETARQLRPRLVLLDVDLPDIDGRELCQRFKAEFKGIPVVLISASLQGDSERLETVRWGDADGFIEEPVEPAALAALLRKVLEAAA